MGRGGVQTLKSQLFIFTLSLPCQSCLSPPPSLSSPFIPLHHSASFPSSLPLPLFPLRTTFLGPYHFLPSSSLTLSSYLSYPLSPTPLSLPLPFLSSDLLPFLSLFLTFLSPSSHQLLPWCPVFRVHPFRISLVCLSYFPHSPPRLFLFFTIFLCSPSLFLPSLDMILDMLRSEDARTAILSYYQDSDEPRAVREAIKESCKTSAEESGLQKWVSLHHAPLHGPSISVFKRLTKKSGASSASSSITASQITCMRRIVCIPNHTQIQRSIVHDYLPSFPLGSKGMAFWHLFAVKI